MEPLDFNFMVGTGQLNLAIMGSTGHFINKPFLTRIAQTVAPDSRKPQKETKKLVQ